MARQYFDPHPQARIRFWLGWAKDVDHPDEYFARTVQPLTISRAGVTVHLTGPIPPKDRPVWVSLGEEVPDMALFLLADVAEINQERRGEYDLRLVFREVCPDDFYRAVTRGIVPERPLA